MAIDKRGAETSERIWRTTKITTMEPECEMHVTHFFFFFKLNLKQMPALREIMLAGSDYKVIPASLSEKHDQRKLTPGSDGTASPRKSAQSRCRQNVNKLMKIMV